MQVINITKNNCSLIEPLLKGYEYNDFRRYAGVSIDGLNRYMKLAFFELLDGNKKNRIICLIDKGEAIGFATINFLKFDSEIFGLPMAKISYIIIKKEEPRVALLIRERLLKEAIIVCRQKKIAHISCRVDTEDMRSAHALERSGFRIMDVLVTLAYARLRSRRFNTRLIYKIGEVRKKDVTKLMKLAAVSFQNDRFHLDCSLDAYKADMLYAQWIKNSYIGKEKIFVAIDTKDNPVGFLTYKINRNFQLATGRKVMGQGLMAVDKNAKGALISLMKATFTEDSRVYDYVEYDTRLNNPEVIRACNYFGLRMVRAKYTFHKSL